MKTVVVVTNIPTPYRIPLFNEVARRLHARGYALHVVFGAWGYKRRQWKIDPGTFEFGYHVLGGSGFYLGRNESITLTYSGLIKYILATKPFLTIVSGFSIASLKLLLCSFVSSARYCIWSGGIAGRGASLGFFRTLQRRLLVRRASNFIVYGSRAAQYLVMLGAKSDRIFTAINTVDVEFFKSVGNRDQMEPVKKGKRVILYVGNLTRGKRIDLVLHALRRFRNQRDDFVFHVVGDGAERQTLEKIVRDFELGDVVEFVGYLQKQEVAERLAGATCFVFPSEYDIWGLVLVEAMAAGVPCIASMKSGATADLIDDGRTGYAVDFEDTARVAHRIGQLLDNPEEAHRMGGAGRDFVSSQANLSVSADGFAAAVEHFAAAGR